MKGTHEPIISEEDYQKVQERLALEGKQPKWNHTGENVLTGLLRCQNVAHRWQRVMSQIPKGWHKETDSILFLFSLSE